jgi:DDE superfamily endonuclease
MLPVLRLPASWSQVLLSVRPGFRAPGFRLFQILATGLVAQTGRKSVVGMLAGSGMQLVVSFHAACRFFSEGTWEVDRVGLCVARLIVDKLVPPGAPILVAVDDTLVKRGGKKVFAALWTHDGAAKTKNAVARGNRWVVVGIVVDLPFCAKPVCLPVLFRLWLGKGSASPVALAGQMLAVLAAAFADREVHGVGDAAYHGPDLLGAVASYTTRLPRNAVLYAPAPARTGRRGRPRVKGARLGTAGDLAGAGVWRTVVVHRYGRREEIEVCEVPVLWYGCFGPACGRIVLVREPGSDKLYELALFTTDLVAGAARIVERYARRWSIEPANATGKQFMGIGQARNRTPRAVRRTVPFAFLVQSLVTVWYAEHGHHPGDAQERRRLSPWYTTKEDPSFEDMLTKLRRVLIYARISGVSTGQASPTEIHAYHLASELTAA